MRILKWTYSKEYYDDTNGEQLTKKEVNKNYRIIKTIKDVEYTIRTAKDTRETYKEAAVTYRQICTRNGKQLSIFND